MEKRFYTAKEVSIYLGLNEETVRKWVQRGYIPFHKFGKSLRFDLHKLENWIKNKECNYSRNNFN